MKQDEGHRIEASGSKAEPAAVIDVDDGNAKDVDAGGTGRGEHALC